MAIGRSKGPRVIAVGEVLRVQERAKKSDAELYAYDVTLATGDGASVFVRVWLRDEAALASIQLGQMWACWAEVVGSREYGDSLSFDSAVTPDDLDRINSALLAPAKG